MNETERIAELERENEKLRQKFEARLDNAGVCS